MSGRFEREKRIEALTRLLACYPNAIYGADQRELTLTQYAAKLDDVPTRLLRIAVDRLISSRRTLPSIADVRFECAVIVRERVRAAQGLETHRPPFEGFPIDRWIARASAPLPALPAQSEVAQSPAERERLRRKLDELIADLERRVRS